MLEILKGPKVRERERIVFYILLAQVPLKVSEYLRDNYFQVIILLVLLL